ncbi:MAG: primosomal replication protein N [Betaproteobacteria bacterium]
MNSTVLDGKIVSRDTLRVTPGGVATLNLILGHQSTQTENGQQVTVEVEMNAVTYGDLAKQMDKLKLNDAISVKGFLSRKSRYSQFPILHITQFKT